MVYKKKLNNSKSSWNIIKSLKLKIKYHLKLKKPILVGKWIIITT
jgi:hypothetical protein